MCDDCKELKKEIDDLRKQLLPRLPEDVDIQFSDKKPWVIDYRGFKHIFLWLPVQQTLSAQEYGSSVTPAQIWINVGFRPGTQVTTVGNGTTTILAILRYTDEVIP